MWDKCCARQASLALGAGDAEAGPRTPYHPIPPLSCRGVRCVFEAFQGLHLKAHRRQSRVNSARSFWVGTVCTGKFMWCVHEDTLRIRRSGAQVPAPQESALADSAWQMPELCPVPTRNRTWGFSAYILALRGLIFEVVVSSDGRCHGRSRSERFPSGRGHFTALNGLL